MELPLELRKLPLDIFTKVKYNFLVLGNRELGITFDDLDYEFDTYLTSNKIILKLDHYKRVRKSPNERRIKVEGYTERALRCKLYEILDTAIAHGTFGWKE